MVMSSVSSVPADLAPEPRFAGLELLRAIAVTMVCLSHAPFFLAAPGQGADWLAVPALGVGVDLFFALSGFLIALSLAELRERSADFAVAASAFYLRRLARIAPLAWIVLAVMALFAALAPRGVLPSADLTQSALFLANIHFGRCFAGASGCGTANLLHHPWSLGLEMQFYILAPLLLLAPAPLLRVLVPAFLILGLTLDRPWQGSLGWAFRVDALLLGFWLGREWGPRRALGWAAKIPPLGWLELLGLLAVIALVPRVMVGPLGGLATGVVAGIAAWIVARAVLPSALPLPGKAAVAGRRLADWSYAVYLVHPPIMILIGWTGLSLVIGFGASMVLAFGLVLAVAAWLTRAIGDPVYRTARTLTRRHLMQERPA
jgi:peptidoglycan/LPS O-acetylase OafA/YrhL